MGIRGLTTFIDRNPHVLHTHEFKDSNVIIDGNNFYHYLYYACHVNCSFGGDYDIYRKKIISTFKDFEQCGITPYVVLDGAYTVDDRKLKTSLMRATMRNSLVGVMARFGRGQILPILAYDTFIQTLTELGVPHVTCQFEADVEIAVLANKFKCPVISNDSDFYIFDLVGGFLPLDYIDFRPLCKDKSGSAPWYLHCQLYKVDDFINAFEGLNRPVLPVFASLLGNDYVKSGDFYSFYKRLQVPKAVSKKYDLPPRLSKIISVIHWFHIHNKDWSKLLQELLQFLEPHYQSRLRNLFITSVNLYSNIDNFEGCDLYAYFTGDGCNFTPVSGPGFAGYNGAIFPKWFLNSVCRGEITPSTMNAAVLHRIIFLSQVESLSEVTAYQCSQGMRRILYGIIFSSDPNVKRETLNSNKERVDIECHLVERFSDLLKPKATEETCVDEGTVTTTDDSQDEMSEEEKDDEEEKFEEEVMNLISKTVQTKSVKRQTQMEEYNRVKRHIERSYLDPTLGMDETPLPALSDLEDLPMEYRLRVMLSAMEVNESLLDKFSSDICLYSCCLLNWLRNADPKISERHLDCILLCLIYVSIHDKLSCQLYKNKALNKEATDDAGSLQSICNEETCSNGEKSLKIDFLQAWKTIPRDQLQKVYENLSKFHKTVPTFNHRNHMDPSILHAFAQLQASMLDASNLNKLLRFPLPNLRPACLYNGTFLYNAFSDLISRPKPDAFLGTLLLSNSSIHQLFLDFKSILRECLPENIFADAPQKHSRKSRKKTKKNRAEPQRENVATKSSDESDEDKEFTAISGFDISNKFSSLLSLS